MPFVACRKYLLKAEFSNSLAKRSYVINGLVDFFLAPRLFRHNPCDRLPMSRNNQCFTALDLVEQRGEVSLGFGGLNLAHTWTFD